MSELSDAIAAKLTSSKDAAAKQLAVTTIQSQLIAAQTALAASTATDQANTTKLLTILPPDRVFIADATATPELLVENIDSSIVFTSLEDPSTFPDPAPAGSSGASPATTTTSTATAQAAA